MKTIVGETRTGKAIYVYHGLNRDEDDIDVLYSGFSPKDLFDLYAILEFLQLRAIKQKTEDTPWTSTLSLLCAGLVSYLTERLELSIDELAIESGCKTSIDIVRLGRKLLRPEFQDL